MLGQDMWELYIDLLTRKEVPLKMRCQVLRNMLMYLMEEEARMIKADQEWKKLQNKEDLKKMGDIQSGMASTIIQVYIKQILESFFHHHSQLNLSEDDCTQCHHPHPTTGPRASCTDCTIFDQYGNRQRQHHQSKG
ncbi:hypothetical protein NP493_639g00000 [Ridgeia piscesae]|uniref:Uncharacterized protein n=1 Tax=Ridgeia piscesae TaxID=27915 RepID=A0AAD9KSS6_RIDPI|nr:hypothetical protein NP493_639g00000 [Ridgeia piscesae]